MPRAAHALPAPAILVALFATGQIVMWTLAPALTHSAPPVDVVESYMWGREWVLGTYKHPALPSWLLEASRIVTGGAVGWPAYFLSQLCVAATFAFVFLLGRDLMDPARAAAGTLLLAGIAHYAWPTPEFNHSIAQTPQWAGFAWALWRAVERRSLSLWALAGALAAGGLYAKLSSGLLLAVAAAWLLLDPVARRALATPGAWIGVAVFAALAAPLGIWLVENDFALLRYAAGRTQIANTIPHFLLSLLGTGAGMLIMLATAGLIGPRRGSAAESSSPISQRALRYLAVMVAGPLALAVAAALINGSGLRSAWASSMFNLTGLLAIALVSDRFGAQALRRIALLAAALVVALPIAYGLTVVLGPRYMKLPLRAHWPQAEIAQRMAGIWQRETGAPLRIVAGENFVAGLVGLTNKDKPSLLSNADLAFSPWISQARLEAEGMLVVWDWHKVPFDLQKVLTKSTGRVFRERFTWGQSPGREDILVGYMIYPPNQGLAPKR